MLSWEFLLRSGRDRQTFSIPGVVRGANAPKSKNSRRWNNVGLTRASNVFCHCLVRSFPCRWHQIKKEEVPESSTCALLPSPLRASHEDNDCPCESGLPKMKVYCGRREILRTQMGKHLPLSHSADIEGGNRFCSGPSAQDVSFVFAKQDPVRHQLW